MWYYGDQPHYHVSKSGKVVPVILNDHVRQCCAFLYVDSRGSKKPLGTAFFLCDQPSRSSPSGFLYLVTARHIIEGARKSGFDNIHVRVNTSVSASPGRQAAEWYVIAADKFLGHPDDDEPGVDWLTPRDDRPRIDLAAAWFPEDPEVFMWPGWLTVTPQVIDDENVSAGANVVITGLYRNHVGEHRNIPIVRSGILSAMPEEPVSTKIGPSYVYLTEARSVRGLSGSPAYLLSEEWVWHSKEGGALTKRNGFQIWLLGVTHGHFDVPDSDLIDVGWGRERMNDGIAMVTPAHLLVDVMHRHEFMNVRTPVEIVPDPASLDIALPESESPES